MSAPRRCYEPGHRPKFLVVVDDSPEADRALYFAARRAARVGATVILLAAIAPGEFQHWFGVGEVAREEAEAEANARLASFAARARAVSVEAETVVRQGAEGEAVAALVEEDEDIALLVLAAGASAEGAGPLVTAMAARAASFPVPIAIVPAQLTDSEIDALA